MKEEPLLLLSDLQKLINQVVLIDYTIIILGSDKMAINNTLKDIREERNLVQADLAKAVGSCSDTIGRIERGERNASLEIAIRLAHYLKMPVEEIFQIED